MRFPQMTVRQMMYAVAVSASLLGLGSCSETAYFTCRVCQNTKEVRTRMIWGLRVWTEVTTSTNHFVHASHVHAWSWLAESWAWVLTGSAEYFW